MKAQKTVPSRRRVLNDEEIVALWRPRGLAVGALLILTMQRHCEVAEMDWSKSI